MFLPPLGSRWVRLALAFILGATLPASARAQVQLANGANTETFDSVGTGLPAGWSVRTGANATSLGTAAPFNTTHVARTSTSGGWRNTAAASDADAAASTNRAVGIRQTGSFGDPGASANFNFATVGLQVTSISFSAQMLSVQSRSTTWSLQYGIGATPSSWTTIATFADPDVFGATTLTASGFGTALDNQADVWLRVVALAASTGSGSRDTFGIDDFTIVTTGGGVATPSIASHPSSQTVAPGQPAHFTVVASGTEPLSYQWIKGTTDLVDGPNISGAQTATLSIASAQAGDAGDYSVRVTNAAGTATSNSATLTVEAPVAPTIATHPVPQSVSVGSVVSFTVAANGTAPLAYQWKKDNVDVTAPNAAGAMTATLTLSNVQLADAGHYSVVVTNSAGEATSNAAVLTVNPVDLYWDLNAANFTQDWSDTSLITVNDNWASVPSIIGYLGRDLTGGTGTNPQTILDPSSALNDMDVIANSANPNTLSSGGVAEFHLTDPTIALQGSGTADAPHLVLHLNTSGRTAVNVAYTIRDIDGSADNAQQQVALQYRVGDVGEFVDVPAGYVADATTQTSATQETPVSVTLPVAVDNQPKVQVRIMTTNAVGNDEWVGIDNITITSAHDGVARVFVTHTNDSTLVGEGGAIDTYRLRLNTTPTGPVTIRAMADTQTEVSADGVNFGSFAEITFTDASPKLVTVRATDDATNEAATHFSTISHTFVSSTDATYPTSFAIASLVAGVVDDDGGTGLTLISTIQGSGPTSPLVNYQVTINGVVTGFFTGSTGTRDGFYVQEQDSDADGDAATSEGVYVFAGSGSPLASTIAALNIGDEVIVTGFVSEFNGLTEVTTLIDITPLSAAVLPAPVSVTLPLPNSTYLERFEGMRITLPQTLTVTDNYDHGHFGQVVLSNGRLPQPTNIVAPGAPAQAQLAVNSLNQIVLDDGTSQSYPEPTPYLFDDGSGLTLRAGDTTTNAHGVLTYQFGLYMLEPTAAPVFTRANPRPTTVPAVGGSLRVAIGNVLNLFNGDGAGGGFPTARGADTYAEYQRQLDKVVGGIIALAPDIMGLTEVENDGYGPTSALAQLVDALNAAAPPGTTYAFVDASAVDIVTDLIHSAFIYRTETVELVGQPAMLSSPYFNNHARNPLAQTFREKATSGVLTVSINHFRAKASVSSLSDGIVPNPNVDQGDGQGTNNYLRTKEAEALAAWLATDPTGSGDPDFMIIGDLNAYAKEDPILALENAGYTNLTEQFEGVGGYSYSFDGAFGHLDHALANSSLTAQVTGAATWHVNADEPIYLDYNIEDKTVAQQAINVGTPYRYSDHDPVVVGVNLTAAPTLTLQPMAEIATVGEGSVTFAVAAIGSPVPTYQWRKNGTDIPGATDASYTIAHPVVADSGSYDVVVTNAVGSTTSEAVTLVVNPAIATLTLSGLTQAYDGSPKAISATTVPSGLEVSITYDGSTTPPTAPGAYAVVATIVDPNYVGTASDTLLVSIGALVRHAPTINGGVDGSVQVLLPESFAQNGGAWVSGDILVPGTPSVRVNGQPTFGGTVDGTGAETPTNYQVTLNGSAVLRKLVRRTDAIALPTVSAPPAPTGTRSATINSAGQSAGDFATLRNLTLNGNAGEVAVPAGTYGTFTANGGNLVFGVVGATMPAVYNLQSLILNGNAKLVVVGPVVLTLANGMALNGSVGTAEHPEWLTVRVANGGVTLNGAVLLHGAVIAPNGTVTINGNSRLNGTVTANRLTINGSGELKAVTP